MTDMTSTLWAAPGIYFAAVDEDVVILDVLADQYHCLLAAADVCRPQGDGAIEVHDEATAKDLERLGLAVRRRPGENRLALTKPARELGLALSPSAGDRMAAAMMYWAAGRVFRQKSLSQLVLFHERRPAAASPDEKHLGELVGAARKARPWVPFEGECLQRAFQLRCFLASRGLGADWIFGVRTWPFSAHCWLQIEDLVVGDRLDRVNRYVPIMRV